MKVYIRDGKVYFYQYRVTGNDSRGRSVTLYAKNASERDNLLSRLSGATSTDISPTTIQQEKALEWEAISNKKDFNVGNAEEYINAANSNNLLSSSEVRVVSQNNASNRFVFDYNESDDSLDIIFDTE